MDQVEYSTQCISSKKINKNYEKRRYLHLVSKSDVLSQQKYEFPVFDFDGSNLDFYRNDQFVPIWRFDASSTSTAVNKSRDLFTQSADISSSADCNDSIVVQPLQTTDMLLVPERIVDEGLQKEADNDYYQLTNEDKYAQVAAFLGKPYRVTTVAWPSTAVVNTNLWTVTHSFNIPSLATAWLNKLKGFQGLRATLCLRAVINTTPFSAGRLRLAYYPCGEKNQRKATIHTSHAVPFSQLPGINISANETTGELKIPYIAPTQYYNMTENGYSWGSLYLNVVAPYRTDAGNPQSVNVTIWAWMEDVQLFGQTHDGIVTQSASIKRPPPSEKESTPLAGFFSNSAKALTSLSSIPGLGAYLGTPIWATNALSGIAASLGWSKPNKAMVFTRNAIGSTMNMANTDGERVGNSLSLFSDAKLAPIDSCSIYKEDELSINFIKKQWSFYKTFTFTTSNVNGDLLFEDFPFPLNYKISVSGTENYYAPIAYLGTHFSLYRGGFEYEVHFLKTRFHRGMVQITFQPGPAVNADLTMSTYLYREIVDLEANNVVRFTVPYINGYEYLTTDVNCGRVQIKVINPLQATETVSTTIDCVVYVRGHDSLQFARARNSIATPYVTQSMSMADPTVKDFGFIGNSVNSDFNIGSSIRCASELPMSLLNLLKRHRLWTTETSAFANPYLRISPYLFSVGGTPTTTHSYTITMSGLMAPYAFFRGGIEMLISEVTTGAYPQTCYLLDNTTTYWNNSITTPAFLDAITRANNVNGGLLLEVPYYNTARVSQVTFQADPTTEAPGFDQPRNTLVIPYNGSSTQISTAVADDFQCCFFVGIPRMGA